MPVTTAKGKGKGKGKAGKRSLEPAPVARSSSTIDSTGIYEDDPPPAVEQKQQHVASLADAGLLIKATNENAADVAAGAAGAATTAAVATAVAGALCTTRDRSTVTVLVIHGKTSW